MVPGPYLKGTLLQVHIANMLLKHYAFEIWSWVIFDLEYSCRLLIVQDHMVLEHMVQDYMVLDHESSENLLKAGSLKA